MDFALAAKFAWLLTLRSTKSICLWLHLYQLFQVFFCSLWHTMVCFRGWFAYQMGGWRSWKDPLGLVLSSFREQIPGGSLDPKAKSSHAPGRAAGIGSWFVCFKNKLLKQGRRHTNCFSVYFHAGRGNNGRGAAGKGLCHGYRPVAENVGGAALVQS